MILFRCVAADHAGPFHFTQSTIVPEFFLVKFCASALCDAMTSGVQCGFHIGVDEVCSGVYFDASFAVDA